MITDFYNFWVNYPIRASEGDMAAGLQYFRFWLCMSV